MRFVMLWAVLYSCFGLVWLLYRSYGHALVASMYGGSAPAILNGVISGQAAHPLDYYLTLSDEAFYRALWSGLFILTGACTLSAGWVSHLYGLSRRWILVAIGLVFAMALLPPVFTRLFAVAPLSTPESLALATLAIIIITTSVAVTLARDRVWRKGIRLILALFFLIGIELGVRLVVNFLPARRYELSALADHTDPERMRYRGHPFLQFTGVPSTAHRLNRFAPPRYNRMGFIGPDFTYAKPAGVVRIACLGGSTTEAGYPALLQQVLRRRSGGNYEVLNFGIAAWNSAHSLVNYVLNVRDFSPDYVVIHDGWNDSLQTFISQARRGDYADTLKPFEPPIIPDRHLVRVSVIYRYVKYRLNPRPDFMMLEHAISRSSPPPAAEPSEDRRQPPIVHFERNVRTMLDLARIERHRVVLLTMPYSTDHAQRQPDSAAAIDENNGILRRLAAEYATDGVILVDLDATMTGHNELFRDLGHATELGDMRKAEQIAQALLARPATAATLGAESHHAGDAK